MRGERQKMESIVYAYNCEHFHYSNVSSSLARSFKRNVSEKYSQPVFGYAHCENRLGDQPDFYLVVSALGTMHTDLCGQR